MDCLKGEDTKVGQEQTLQFLDLSSAIHLCLDSESNTGPPDLQSGALPTELSRHFIHDSISRNLRPASVV